MAMGAFPPYGSTAAGRRLAAPGWYADPLGAPGSIRWWDGARWTGTTAWPAGYEQPPPAPPPAPPPPSGRPDRSETATRFPMVAVWWALLGLAAGEVAGGVLGTIVALATGAGATSAPVTLAGEIGLWAGMLGACILVVRRYGTGSVRRDLLLRMRPLDLAWGPLATVVGLIATAVLSQPFAGTRLAGSNTQLIDGQAHDTVGFVVVAVLVSVGAPVVEELFFRGLLRTALRARLGPVPAVVAQGGLFGLAHLNPASGLGNVEVVVVIGALGMILGTVAHLTDRLAPGMIGHGLYNLLVTLSILSR